MSQYEYCSASSLNIRKVSTKPWEMNVSIQARSWGMNPDIFAFSLGRAMSISRCAVLTSPQTTSCCPAAVRPSANAKKAS